MIQDLFRKLNEEMGITVIIVTHDISLANKVGRVVMIADGKISTEKIMKEDYRKRINDMESESFNGTDSHEEYSIMDKAHRVQISDDILESKQDAFSFRAVRSIFTFSFLLFLAIVRWFDYNNFV